MSLSETTKTVHIGDKPYTFRRLTIEDLFSFTDSLKAEREKTARDLGASEKLTKTEITNLILQVRSIKPTVQDVLNSCDTPDGATAVLKKSLTKAGYSVDDQKLVLSGIKTPDALETARMLILDEQETQSADPLDPASVPSTSV